MYINTTIKEENINLNYDYSYQNEKLITPFAFFPQKKLSQLLFDLNIVFYLERAYCFKTVIKIAYSRYESSRPLKIKSIYREASVILNKNFNTIQSNVRLCIQDIVNNAPDELLHSIFYYNRSELKEHLYPKYFIIQILDYLNNQNSY